MEERRPPVRLAHAIKRRMALTLALPYVRRELPGWGKVYARLVSADPRDPVWQGTAPRRVRGKFHGYELQLDLGGWSNR